MKLPLSGHLTLNDRYQFLRQFVNKEYYSVYGGALNEIVSISLLINPHGPNDASLLKVTPTRVQP